MASQYRRRSLMLNTIAKVAQGNPTIITDSSSRRLQKLNIYGQSEQDGTPSPENPVEIISKEVSEIKVTNGADLSQTITLAEPITLRGIPVSSDGNVTIDGQQYIADVIKEKNGVIGVDGYVQELLVSSMNKLYLTVGTHTNGQPYLSCNNENKDTYIRDIFPLCNRYIGSYYIMDNGKVYIPNAQGFIINDNRFTDRDTAISIITDEETKVLLPLLNSTFTPLPEEIQTQYKALKSYYPNTVIQTGCWNEVTYSAKRGG